MPLCSDISVNFLMYLSVYLPITFVFIICSYWKRVNNEMLYFDFRTLKLVDLFTNGLCSTLMHTHRSHHKGNHVFESQNSYDWLLLGKSRT